MGVVDGCDHQEARHVTKMCVQDSLHRELSCDTPQGLLWDDDDAQRRHIKNGRGHYVILGVI